MAMVFDSSRIALWSGNLFASVAQWWQSLTGHADVSPEQTLANTPNVDPRLIPRVAMGNTDIDVHLLNELGQMGMKRGKLVTEQSHPELMAAWREMSARAGLKQVPQLIITESKTVNAMTVSPEEVVVTTGLLKLLNLREVTAVLGHELGHVNSDHKRPRIIAHALFGGLGAIGGDALWRKFRMGKVKGHTPLSTALEETAFVLAGAAVGSVVANQVSVRPTELEADRKGAAISGDPEGLILALQKLEASRKRSPLVQFLGYLQSGYPSVSTRIENLRQIAAGMKEAPVPPALASAETPVIAAPAPGVQITQVSPTARLEAAPAADLAVS